ncbi:MAG: glycoside hydrolase family 25 protein [Lachnospiraceae bacterium]|nr:glycoside hydrolase family 25 protein [Lachnospiraceae bacterium]
MEPLGRDEAKKKMRNEKHQNNRKRRETGNLLVTIAVCFIALASLTGCIYLLLENQSMKQEFIPVMGRIEDDVFGNQEESVKEEDENILHVDDEEEEIDLLTQALLENKDFARQNTADEVLDELKFRLTEGEEISAILRAMFPNDMVVIADGKYYFIPILDELKKHSYNTDNFVLDDNGILAYHDDDGNIISQKGIDVSRYQETIDWGKVANDGVDFAIIRVGFRGSSEGTLVVDTYYEGNMKGALDNGVDVGVYFFTQALNEAEAIEEAEFVLEHIAEYDVKYPVVIDVEAIDTRNPRTQFMTQEEWTNITIAFCERIKEAGYTPMIYGNLRSFFLMLDMTRLEDYEKWFAFFRPQMYFPYEHSIWQYTAKGTVAGIKGEVDLNVGFKVFE